MERQLTQDSGNKLDAYEMEVLNERADLLKDLAEFQLAVVRLPAAVCWAGGPQQLLVPAARRAALTRRCCEAAPPRCPGPHPPRPAPATSRPAPRLLPAAPCLAPPAPNHTTPHTPRAQTLYNGMLENNCSEHASRMAAMENSTKSASEMLSALTLAYNRCARAPMATGRWPRCAGRGAPPSVPGRRPAAPVG
jgi:hypothetical protein